MPLLATFGNEAQPAQATEGYRVEVPEKSPEEEAAVPEKKPIPKWMVLAGLAVGAYFLLG